MSDVFPTPFPLSQANSVAMPEYLQIHRSYFVFRGNKIPKMNHWTVSLAKLKVQRVVQAEFYLFPELHASKKVMRHPAIISLAKIAIFNKLSTFCFQNYSQI